MKNPNVNIQEKPYNVKRNNEEIVTSSNQVKHRRGKTYTQGGYSK